VASLIVGYGVGTGAVDRIPGTLVVLTLLLPVAVTTLKVTGIYPPGGTGINFTPAVNALSLVFLALAIVEFRLFDLLPAGRKRAVDVMTDGYVLLDETDTVVDTNRAAVSLLGADPDAALAGRALTDLVPESVAGDLATDGGAATFSVGGRVLQAVPSSISRDGEQAGRVLVLRDLTDQRARMEELTAKNERLQALFANTTAAVVEYVADDGEPIVVDVNAQFESLFGYNAARVVGRPLDEFVGPIADGTDATTLAAAIGRGENLSTEVERETVDGVRTFLLRHTPIDGTDDRRGYASYRDITERRADEQQLESQMTQLEVLNRIVRHDINNHMTVVLGMVAAARDDIDDPEVRDRLDRALRASENVTGLTTTARDLMQTMLSDGTEPEPVWLSHVLVDEIEDVQSAAADATIVVDGTLPNVQVMADDLLGSVFRNLLQNAVQHNDADTPTVRVGADATEKSVEITVADNGPGVPPERRETVFGKDEKGIASEGTGIGLYLVHSLVDSYGGEVWVTDNEPRGAVFHVRLERA
jgi:PAS domain S-box-containing protein